MTVRVALVAGGSGGIGRAAARRLAQDCAVVYCGYCSHPVESGPEGIRAVHLDVLDTQSCDQVCEQIHREHGRLDILVNSVALNLEAPALALSDEDWRRVVDTNLGGSFRLCRAAGKYMMLGKWGRIINISSISAERGGRGQINYASSKAGLEALTRVLALELGRKGVLCNCVAPGVIETALSERIRADHGQELLNAISLRRFGRPEEVAEVIAFLASDSAAYINGQVIRVDGGLGL